MPVTETNSLARARQAVTDNEDCDIERIKVLISTIEDAGEEAAAINEQRDALRVKAVEAGKKVEDAYVELEGLIPANPLGNLNIGAV